MGLPQRIIERFKKVRIPKRNSHPERGDASRKEQKYRQYGPSFDLVRKCHITVAGMVRLIVGRRCPRRRKSLHHSLRNWWSPHRPRRWLVKSLIHNTQDTPTPRCRLWPHRVMGPWLPVSIHPRCLFDMVQLFWQTSSEFRPPNSFATFVRSVDNDGTSGNELDSLPGETPHKKCAANTC